MKIGILTHHYVKNYGAFLQMKAMYETLQKLYPDATVEIIHYVKKVHFRRNVIHILHYRKGIDSFSTYLKKIGQLKTFTQYEHSLKRSKRVYNAKQINQLGYDLIVLGSDEIWNILSAGYDPLKFGYGLDAGRTKLVAYAPSVGAVTNTTPVSKEVKEGLLQLDRISARDIETQNLVKRGTGKEIVKLLDPTFLYQFDGNINEEHVKLPKDYGDYILIYDCKLTKEQIFQLKEYANKKNYRIIGAGDYKTFYDDVTIKLTPYEWVNLFKNAKKVITGTFHGTVFSLKYDKDFVCYPTEKNRINKISSLLKDFGFGNRLLKISEEQRLVEYLETPLDYSMAHHYISQKKMEAEEFLFYENL